MTKTYSMKGGVSRDVPNENRGQMLNRASLELARLASKDEDRPNLNVLRITEHETIATNGVFLGRITHPVVDRQAVEVNAPVELVDQAIADCSIPRDVALDIAKLIPKPSEEQPHHFAFVDLADAVKGKLMVAVKQADATQRVEIGEVQLDFPSARTVTPSKRGRMHFTMNRRLLDGILAAARRMGLDSDLHFYVHEDAENALLIEGRIRDTEQHATFVVMPMRSEAAQDAKKAAKDAAEAAAEPAVED